MSTLKNARHERFAQELAGGKSASEAYVAAGFKANRGNATVLKQQQSVLKRVEELLDLREKVARVATEKAAEALAIDREWVLARLKENVERAMQAVPVLVAGQPSGEFRYDGAVANRALELLGKELGMFVDRSEVRHGRTLEELILESYGGQPEPVLIEARVEER